MARPFYKQSTSYAKLLRECPDFSTYLALERALDDMPVFEMESGYPVVHGQEIFCRMPGPSSKLCGEKYMTTGSLCHHLETHHGFDRDSRPKHEQRYDILKAFYQNLMNGSRGGASKINGSITPNHTKQQVPPTVPQPIPPRILDTPRLSNLVDLETPDDCSRTPRPRHRPTPPHSNVQVNAGHKDGYESDSSGSDGCVVISPANRRSRPDPTIHESFNLSGLQQEEFRDSEREFLELQLKKLQETKRKRELLEVQLKEALLEEAELEQRLGLLKRRKP